MIINELSDQLLTGDIAILLLADRPEGYTSGDLRTTNNTAINRSIFLLNEKFLRCSRKGNKGRYNYHLTHNGRLALTTILGRWQQDDERVSNLMCAFPLATPLSVLIPLAELPQDKLNSALLKNLLIHMDMDAHSAARILSALEKAGVAQKVHDINVDRKPKANHTAKYYQVKQYEIFPEYWELIRQCEHLVGVSVVK